MRTLHGKEMRRIRKFKNLTQEEFWNRVGVTQCGGCRYEKGRRIPRPVQLCLHIAYSNTLEQGRALNHLIPPTHGEDTRA